LHLVLLLLSIFSVGQNLQFEKPSISEGLPNNMITDLLQDKQGFLWIGTTDGLYRYNGRTVKEFRHSAIDTNTLSNNGIRCLFEDANDNLWIGTNMGLNFYDTKKNQFRRLIFSDTNNNMANNFIIDVIVDKQNQVWYATYNGLFMMNTATSEHHHFLPYKNDLNSLTHKTVWQLFEDNKGRLWFGTNNGFVIYDNDGTFKFIQYLPDFDKPDGLQSDKVWAFCQQEDSTIWLGTYDGLFRVNETANKFTFTKYCYESKNDNSLSYNYIEDIKIGPNNSLFVGTWNGGLNEIVLSSDKPKFYHYKATPNNPHGISHNNVTSCLIDRSGILWVGTMAGLSRANLLGEKFSTIFKDDRTVSDGSTFHVNAILIDNNKNLWIGTRGDGLLFLEAEKLKNSDYRFTTYKSGKGSISHNNIYGIYQDGFGEIWVNTYNALNQIQLNDKGLPESWHYYDSGHGLGHSFTTDILQENDSVYWISTYGKLSMMTINSKDREEFKIRNFDMDLNRDDALVNATTYSICIDRFGQLWIGTFGGLSKLISKEGEGSFENYIYDTQIKDGIGGTQVGILFCDSKGRMWAGTEGGLSYFNQKTKNEKVSFQTFGMECGLPNDVIKSIREDADGNLWLATNRGIAVFSTDLALSGKKPVLKIFNINDGLQANVFNHRSSFKDSDGILYFGGIDGLNIINPKNILVNNKPPKTVFTGFKLFNKSVYPSDSSGSLLKKAISHTDTIILSYYQNDITFEFVALDFVKAVENEYAYYLEGYEKDWIYSGKRNYTTYTHLPSGEYILRAKGTNNDGVWSEEPAEILIISLPPFWETWWAIVFYIVVFVIILIVFIHYRIKLGLREMEKEKAIEVARYEERELLRKKNAADFHDELGHNITKISLFLELASRQVNIQTSVSKYLDKVKENTMSLSAGIRDLIWTIDPKKDSLYEIILRLRDFGNQLFEFSDITFRTSTFTKALQEFEINAERRKHILLLFKEAMNNSLKYSKAKRADFTILINNQDVNLVFKDNGIGFNIDTIKKGYGLKNIVERAEKAGAKCIITSSKGEGTSINVSINLEL